MKFHLTLFLVLFIVIQVYSQPVFKKMYGSFSASNFELIEIPGEYQFLISNHNNSNTDHTFFKVSENGEPFNQQFIYQSSGGSTYGSHKFHFFNDSIYDLIGLQAGVPGSYPVVAFLNRRDSSLQNSIISKYYSYRPSGPGIKSILKNDNTYTLAGGFSDTFNIYYPIIFNLNVNLDIAWSRKYMDFIGYIKDIVQVPDGGLYLLLQLASEGMALAKMDSAGTILWCKNYHYPFRFANGLIALPSGNLLLYGYMNPGSASGYSTIEVFICKVDSMGNVLWSNKLGDSNITFYRMGVDPVLYLDTVTDNRIVMTGIIRPATGSFNDMVIMLMDSSGNLQWSRRYGNNYFDEAGTIVHQTSDGGFILGGYNNYQINNFPPVQNEANVTVIKTDSLGISDGCMEYPVTIYSEPDTPLVTNLSWSIYVDSIVTEIPSNMVDTTGTPTRNENMCTFVSLMESDNPGNFVELFPNPTHGQFTIKSRSDISIVTVYDITGRRVLEEALTGLLSYSINLEGQPAGLYQVQIAIGDKVVTRKIAVD